MKQAVFFLFFFSSLAALFVRFTNLFAFFLLDYEPFFSLLTLFFLGSLIAFTFIPEF